MTLAAHSLVSSRRRHVAKRSSAERERVERRSGGGRDTRPARFAHFVSLSWPFRPFGPGTGPGEWRVSLRSSLTRPCLPPPRRETRRPPAPYPALTPPAFSLRSRTAGGGPGSWSLPTVVLLTGAARPYHHHHRAFAGPPSEPAHSLRLRSHYRSIFVSLIPPGSPPLLSVGSRYAHPSSAPRRSPLRGVW